MRLKLYKEMTIETRSFWAKANKKLLDNKELSELYTICMGEIEQIGDSIASAGQAEADLKQISEEINALSLNAEIPTDDQLKHLKDRPINRMQPA